uniref:Velvet domain-containing protein n=1 Tax=Angiostrongylus cantonensis TaxID=6313 RepID=A0A0K0DLQ8_ANGCA
MKVYYTIYGLAPVCVSLHGTIYVRKYGRDPRDQTGLLRAPLVFFDTKEEILTITSPLSHHEDQNDSGIENRTTDSHSPSTSLDFSPRSDSKHTPDRLISSKVPSTPPTTTESSSPPDYPPPPPPPAPLQPPTSSDSTLDQVLIPLNVSRTISAIQRKPDIDDYPSSSLHLQRFGRRTPVSINCNARSYTQ